MLQIVSRCCCFCARFFRLLIWTISWKCWQFEHGIDIFRLSFTFLNIENHDESLCRRNFTRTSSSAACSSSSSLVNSWAFAKLSTAIAKNTFNKVSKNRNRTSSQWNEINIFTISKQNQNDEIKRVNHSLTIGTALWNDSVVHNFIPIFTCKYLKTRKELTDFSNERFVEFSHLKDRNQSRCEFVEILQRCFFIETESKWQKKKKRQTRDFLCLILRGLTRRRIIAFQVTQRSIWIRREETTN